MTFSAVMVVPTGLGAEIGGYAGDATPAANLLASVCDRLITHPNVVNAASLFAARPNLWYVEGGLLDRFCLGRVGLAPARANRVGLVIDRAIVDGDEAGLAHLLNAAEAMRAVHGLELSGWSATSEPMRQQIVAVAGGCHAEIDNPYALVAAGRGLVAAGAEAIALVTRMPELPADAEAAYMAGQGPDPIGELEALASRIVGAALEVPCAHAPYEPFEDSGRVDPRLAAEQIGMTFLPCVLAGLARAPRPARQGGLRFDDVSAVVAPYSACGGIPVLAAQRAGIPIVAVRENRVCRGADPEQLGLRVLVAENYLEAAGMLAALRAGLAIATIRRPLAPLGRLGE